MSEPDLSAKQERALVALMGARTLDDAAARAEVGQRTLRQWRRGCSPARARLRNDLPRRVGSFLASVSTRASCSAERARRWQTLQKRRSPEFPAALPDAAY